MTVAEDNAKPSVSRSRHEEWQMKNDGSYIAVCAILCAAWLFFPAASVAKDLNLSVNFEGNGDSCADLRVKSNGQIAQNAESFNLQRNQAPVLEILDSAGHGAVRVRGWEHQRYTVDVCKIAVAETGAAADQLLRGIGVTRSAGRFNTTGPSGPGTWQTYFIVHAPKDGSIDVETKNGPIDIALMSGTVKARAGNGPIALKDCGGQVEANTANGPIAFSGQGGEVHLRAQNGPISVNVAGDVWNGSVLEARAVNGPVSLAIPDTFRTGVRVETSHGPMSCGAAPCRNAWSDESRRTMQFNGSQDTIRLSTENGPVSVGNARKSGRLI
jgi:hypothetical protein